MPTKKSKAMPNPAANSVLATINICIWKENCIQCKPWYRSAHSSIISPVLQIPTDLIDHTISWRGVWRQLIPLNDKTAFAVREQAGHSLKSSLQVCHDALIYWLLVQDFKSSVAITNFAQLWVWLQARWRFWNYWLYQCINDFFTGYWKDCYIWSISSPITIGWLLHWLY